MEIDEELIASVNIFKKLNTKEIKVISAWLREQAWSLEKEGKNYATRFRAAHYWKRGRK